jgi:hypothetical protein
MEQPKLGHAGSHSSGPEALDPAVSESGEREQFGAEVRLERRE